MRVKQTQLRLFIAAAADKTAMGSAINIDIIKMRKLISAEFMFTAPHEGLKPGSVAAIQQCSVEILCTAYLGIFWRVSDYVF